MSGEQQVLAPSTPAAAGAPSLSVSDVAAWLRANNYGATAVELFNEMERCSGERFTPLLEVAEASQQRWQHQLQQPTSHHSKTRPMDAELSSSSLRTMSPSSSSVQPAARGGDAPTTTNALASTAAPSPLKEALCNALQDCLDTFEALMGGNALACVLAARGMPSAARGNTSSSSNADATPEHQGRLLPDAGCSGALSAALSPVAEWETDAAESARRVRAAEAQLAQLVTVVADSLVTLVTAVDPMKKEALLPLLRSVAVLADSSTGRAAARHAILHLFKRPSEENRTAIVAEWLRVTQAAPARTMEQEVIPELYGLVNARTPERRQLALDCACAVADQIQHAVKVRYALCQGLLRPLSEDESSAVRRQVPRCLGALWGGSDVTGGEDRATAMRPNPTLPSPSSPSAGVDGTPPPSEALTQQGTFPMELAARLALDPFSNSVRHAAQAQLREVIYPKCLRDHVLLSDFVPLLIALIGMEVTPLLRTEDLGVPAGGAEREPSSSRGAVRLVDRRDATALRKAPRSAATSSTDLAYSNVVMLVKLVGDAIQCVKRHLAKTNRGGGGGVGGSAATTTSQDDAVVDEVADVFLRVVLPAAHSLFPTLLSIALPATGTPRQRRRAGGPLCGLVASLAGLIPALGESAWERAKAYFLSSLQPPSLDRGDSPEMRGRLMFAYVVFIRLAGEQTAFHEQQPHANVRSVRSVRSGSPNQAITASDPGQRIQSLGDDIGQQSASLILQSLTTKPSSTPLSVDERIRVLASCLGQLGSLSLGENDRLSAGIIAVLWTFAESPSATQRLHLVSLVHHMCCQPLEDTVKTSFVCPPLYALLNDTDATVQEMAVKGLLSAAAGLTHGASQAKILRPTLATVEASGCTSDLTLVTLQHWEALLPTMPAEPREVFLYPQLNVLMDRLSEQQNRRTLARQQRASATSTPKHGPPTTSLTPDERREQDQWEGVMSALLSLLAAILRCAVVTPPLVAKYLMPGIRHISSSGLLSDATMADQLRGRWERLDSTYRAYMEHNSAFAATQQAANLINRVRDELKRHF